MSVIVRMPDGIRSSIPCLGIELRTTETTTGQLRRLRLRDELGYNSPIGAGSSWLVLTAAAVGFLASPHLRHYLKNQPLSVGFFLPVSLHLALRRRLAVLRGVGQVAGVDRRPLAVR